MPAIPPVTPELDAERQSPTGTQPPTEQLQACPWLYIHTDPDARAAFVTADHRCEIRPDEVPGPGHQLAYCLTPNHVSCPQLRNYEAQRRAAAQEPRVRPTPLATAVESSRPARTIPTPQVGGIRNFAMHAQPTTLASRLVWAAAGIAGTLAFVAGLAIVASPDDASSAVDATSTLR